MGTSYYISEGFDRVVPCQIDYDAVFSGSFSWACGRLLCWRRRTVADILFGRPKRMAYAFVGYGRKADVAFLQSALEDILSDGMMVYGSVDGSGKHIPGRVTICDAVGNVKEGLVSSVNGGKPF